MKPKIRARDRDKQPPDSGAIDTSGRLPSGETFEDFAGLQRILITTEREKILRNVVQRFLRYALCRKLELADRPAVDAIVQQLESNDGTFGDLIHAIVDSLPFRQTVWESN